LNHLHKIELPQLDDTERLFVAIADFVGQETDDLSFTQGKIIVKYIYYIVIILSLSQKSEKF